MSIRSLTLFFLLAVFTATPALASLAPANPAAATKKTAEETALEAARTYRASLDAMTARERRQFKRDQRRAVRDAVKAHKTTSQDPDTSTVLLVILAILLPPVAVLVYEGGLTDKFWIALLLTLLFYLPGLIYALVTIL